MPILRRATDQQAQTEWRNVDEGVWRLRLGKPELKFQEATANRRAGWMVKTVLMLTPEEQARLLEEHGDEIRQLSDRGGQQSFRVTYTCGLSLGFFRNGKFETTRLLDFLAACLGQGQVKKFRTWIEQGGGPPRPDDLNDEKAELDMIADWLGWWEDLEVYGTVTHNEDKEVKGKFWPNFAGPMPVGSLPGQKDPDYDALGRGKLRAIMTESGETRESNARENATTMDRPAERYTSDGARVAGDGSEALPWG